MKRLNALLLCLAAVPLGAVQTDLGGADALFPLLQEPAGARSLSMGQAYEAVAEGAEGALYNPAAPAYSQDLEAALHHDAWLANTSRESLQLSSPVGDRAGMSGYGTYVGYPSLQLRDAQGNLKGDARPNDWGVGLAGGYRFWPGLALGLGAQALRQELPGLSLRGVNVDVGLLAKPNPALSLALVVRNRPLRDVSEDKRGFRSTLGAAYRLGEARPLITAFSVALDPESPAQAHLGLEQSLGPALGNVALRGGYTAFFPGYSLGAGHGVALGAGFNWGRLGVDYACQLFGSFGVTQQFSLTWNQRAPVPAPKLEIAATPVPTPSPTAPEPPSLPMVPNPVPTVQPSTTLLVLKPKDMEAQALEREGQLEAALKLYQEAVSEDAQDRAAWFGLARVYRALGHQTEALQAQERALALKEGL